MAARGMEAGQGHSCRLAPAGRVSGFKGLSLTGLSLSLSRSLTLTLALSVSVSLTHSRILSLLRARALCNNARHDRSESSRHARARAAWSNSTGISSAASTHRVAAPRSPRSLNAVLASWILQHCTLATRATARDTLASSPQRGLWEGGRGMTTRMPWVSRSRRWA